MKRLNLILVVTFALALFASMQASAQEVCKPDLSTCQEKQMIADGRVWALCDCQKVVPEPPPK